MIKARKKKGLEPFDEQGEVVAGRGQDGVDAIAVAALEIVTRLVRLTFLAPDIIKDILDGHHPPTVNAAKLLKDTRLPLDWNEQRAALGFA